MFVYDKSSPSCLRWAVDIIDLTGRIHSKARKGAVAGSISANGYWTVFTGGKGYRIHRIVFELCHNKPVPENHDVDHIDGNTLNNETSNLRVTKFNMRNKIKAVNNSSGITGVSLSKSVVISRL